MVFGNEFLDHIFECGFFSCCFEFEHCRHILWHRPVVTIRHSGRCACLIRRVVAGLGWLLVVDIDFSHESEISSALDGCLLKRLLVVPVGILALEVLSLGTEVTFMHVGLRKTCSFPLADLHLLVVHITLKSRVKVYISSP